MAGIPSGPPNLLALMLDSSSKPSALSNTRSSMVSRLLSVLISSSNSGMLALFSLVNTEEK